MYFDTSDKLMISFPQGKNGRRTARDPQFYCSRDKIWFSEEFEPQNFSDISGGSIADMVKWLEKFDFIEAHDHYDGVGEDSWYTSSYYTYTAWGSRTPTPEEQVVINDAFAVEEERQKQDIINQKTEEKQRRADKKKNELKLLADLKAKYEKPTKRKVKDDTGSE